MRRLFTLIAVSAGLVLPTLASALPPPNVTGIAAEYSDGQVHVHWEAVQDDTVSFYRVYYGRQSILESGGQYDDFETVDGKLTTYIIKNPPNGDTFYVSVLAVNNQLEESDLFREEAKVTLTEGDAVGSTDPSVPSTQSPFRRERDANTIGLVSADQISSTEVLLTFSHDVILLPSDGAAAFRIENGSGNALTLRRLVIQGASVRITTDPQKRGETYAVSVSAVVTGESPAGSALPLDDTRSTGEFTAAIGIDDDLAAAAASSSSTTSSVSSATASSVSSMASSSSAAATPTSFSGSLISDLQLTSTEGENGLWRVTVEWTPSIPAEEIGAFIVRAEREGKEISLPPGEHTMVFSGVKKGTFTVSVRLMANNETESTAKASIVLKKGATVITKGTLTNSGAGLTAILAMSGGLAAWRRMRQKRSADEQNVILG